jgi:hypothetical protein
MSEIFLYLTMICFALLCLTRLIYFFIIIFRSIRYKRKDNKNFESMEGFYNGTLLLVPLTLIFLFLYWVSK